jgi:hypothetical protein
VDAARLRTWWAELEAFFREEVRRHRGSIQSYLQARNPVWNLVRRVYFHLAETKGDGNHPFAFLATYTTRLSGQARPQHQPSARRSGLSRGPGGPPVPARPGRPRRRGSPCSRTWWTRGHLSAARLDAP